MSTESSEGEGDESLTLAVADAGEPRLSASAPPGFRNSVRRRLSSLLLGRDSSVISEVHLPPGRTAGQVVVQVLDSLPLQLVSLLLVVFTLFAADIANYTSAPDSADAYINAFLLASLAAFAVEIALNVAFRPRNKWFPVLLDVVATCSILIDVTWVAAAVGLQTSASGAGGSGSGELGNHAAVVTSKAGRIIRLVRVIRILRMMSVVTSIMTALLHRWTKAGDDKHAPSNIGSKLTDATTMQVALVVISTVIGAALLLGLGGASAAPLAAFVTVFQAQAEAAGGAGGGMAGGGLGGGVAGGREALQPLVDEMLAFAEREVPDLIPLALRVGSYEWSWAEQHGGYSPRSVDTVRLTGGDSVTLAVDVSRLNHHTALMDMALIVFIVGLLLLFVATLNLTAYRLLVRPLERIFNTIRQNAAQVVAALEGGPDGQDGDSSSEGDGDVGTIEAAVVKMSRIVAHFTAAGGQGAQLMKNMAQNADHATQEWLSTFVGGGGGGGDSGGSHLSSESASAEAASSPAPGSDFLIKSTGTGVPASHAVHAVAGAGGGGGALRAPGGSAGAGLAGKQPGGPTGPMKLDRRSSLQCFLSSSPKPSIAPTAATSSALGQGPLPGAPAPQPPPSPKGLTRTFLEASGLTAAQHSALLGVSASALQSLSLDVCELGEGALVPLVVSMFMDLNLAYCKGTPADGSAALSPELGGNPRGSATGGEGRQGQGFTDVVVLWRFVEQVSSHYRAVPYHNFFHAVDVCHTVYWFIKRLGHKVGLSPIEKLALMTAALCHDMEHPGVNNSFLVSTRADLATTYNDNSVLENRHVAALYGMLAAHPDADIFRGLDPGQWREVRRALIAAVLHTDMVHHFAMVSKVEVFYELHAAEVTAAHKAARHGGARDGGASGPALFTSAEDRTLLLCLLLHSADIGNPLRPGRIARKWAGRVMDEFFAQGEMERAAGLPVSPMCDRTKATMAQSQINFIEFVVAPLYLQVVKIFPEVGEMVDNLQTNRRMWEGALAEEISGDATKSPADKAAELQKAEARLAAFLDKHKEVFERCARAARTRHPAGISLPHGGPAGSPGAFPGAVAGSGTVTGVGGPPSALPAYLLSARAAGGALVSQPSAASLVLSAEDEGAAAAEGEGAGEPPEAAALGTGGSQRTSRELSQLELRHGGTMDSRSSAEAGGEVVAGPGGAGPAESVVVIRRTSSTEARASSSTRPEHQHQQPQQQHSSLTAQLHLHAGSGAGGMGSRGEREAKQRSSLGAAPSLPAASSSAAGASRAGSKRGSDASSGGAGPKRDSQRRSSLLEAVVVAAAAGLAGGAGGSAGGTPGSSPRGSAHGGSTGAGLLRRGSSRSFTGANRVMPRQSSSEEGGGSAA